MAKVLLYPRLRFFLWSLRSLLRFWTAAGSRGNQGNEILPSLQQTVLWAGYRPLNLHDGNSPFCPLITTPFFLSSGVREFASEASLLHRMLSPFRSIFLLGFVAFHHPIFVLLFFQISSAACPLPMFSVSSELRASPPPIFSPFSFFCVADPRQTFLLPLAIAALTVRTLTYCRSLSFSASLQLLSFYSCFSTMFCECWNEAFAISLKSVSTL